MPEPREGTVTDARSEVHQTTPRMWRVLVHNDDFTTQEFVVWVLEIVFQKAKSEATTIMLHVHHAGIGVAGIYTRDVAESKIAATERLAEQHEFPLRVTMEPEHEETSR
jgi:ATP-dependent Clp protease adaptor protein ClpS